VSGSGFRLKGSGSRVEGSLFRIWCLCLEFEFASPSGDTSRKRPEVRGVRDY
jgi:hypothetical protein